MFNLGESITEAAKCDMDDSMMRYRRDSANNLQIEIFLHMHLQTERIRNNTVAPESSRRNEWCHKADI